MPTHSTLVPTKGVSLKKFIGTLATLASFAVVAPSAKAELVRFDTGLGGNIGSFVDIGGIGFGAAPRLLTLQTDPFEAGASTPTGLTGNAEPGANKSATVTLGQMGWLPGNFVAVGFDTNQTGGSGITLNALTLNLYNASSTLVDLFSIASPIQYTEQDLDLQQGNGSGIFAFVLNAAQRAEWNALNPQANWIVGLFASLGCASPSATCQPSNSGAESFLAIAAGNPTINPVGVSPVPLPAAGWMFGAGLVGLAMLGLRRKRVRQTA